MNYDRSNDIHFEMKSKIMSEVYQLDRNLIFKKSYDFREPQWNSKFKFHLLNNGLGESGQEVIEQLQTVLGWYVNQ